MAGFHTLTLYLPKPTLALYVLLYRFLSAVTDRYEEVPYPDDYHAWPQWNTVMLCSTPHHDVLAAFLCRGGHFDHMTQHRDARGYQHIGYISIYAVLKVYWFVFKTGHYVEVVAFSENHGEGDAQGSDLYVRVPSIQEHVYAVVQSSHTVEASSSSSSSSSSRPSSSSLRIPCRHPSSLVVTLRHSSASVATRRLSPSPVVNRRLS